MLLSSRAYQPSTNVTTNQTASRMAVMTRFFRQYSRCLSVSSNQVSPEENNELFLSTRFFPTVEPDAYIKLPGTQIGTPLPHRTNSSDNRGMAKVQTRRRTYVACFSCSRIWGFSSVETSCLISSPLAMK